ncbi:hypothetical protein [Micromonospora cathayae]|uniref:Uncharacterized protein n=1 Tax=Micromonospora cathayae TaxID=3028804 RepID=A0ABY7ZYK6_9ACTN|nr:hypothetical protein [Micromonospora sp. HUAS 3]WDZ87177.1 hypothetical protein PVK37_12615 [Micromonospora sp. HUAS 3]
MTSAPETLLAARRLLLEHLDIQPGRTVHTDLDPAEVGIVGDPAHVGGYHCGADRVRRVDGRIRDYSVTESDRDRSGLADWACALDIGEFRVTVGGRTYDLPHLSAWIVGQCRAGAPDARDIREVIWSPDGRSVQRWDRLGRRDTGDSSHRWHTHISYHRDAIRAGRDQTALFRRYLTSIGLLAGEEGGPLSALTDKEQRELLTLARSIKHLVNVAGYRVEALVSARPTYDNQMGDKKAPNRLAQQIGALGQAIALESASPTEVRALLAELPAPPAPPSAADIAGEVLAGLGGRSPADVAQALVAAGQDPGRLATELTRLAGQGQARG